MYQLKITLNGITPHIWRRLLVSENITLYKLHHIIQESFGWTNSHLYFFGKIEFKIGDIQLWDDKETTPDNLVKIRDVLVPENPILIYTYDMGDDWVHTIELEQVLPEIETKTNELLDRLSDGQMSVRFITQTEYKDRKREDLKETLDIQISDSTGVRDYEMYSGGEAFRINFAIRLALSEVLAQRKGARLQTLVIDEGFGSQDNQGRQRLIEAINLVKSDFAKIIVITHLDELKDAFPTRIEVEKTDRGSRVTVV